MSQREELRVTPAAKYNPLSNEEHAPAALQKTIESNKWARGAADGADGDNKEGLRKALEVKSSIVSCVPPADKTNEEKEFPFIIFPFDEVVSPAPPFFGKPAPSIPATYYALYCCEGHGYDLIYEFTSKGTKLTPRGRHAGTLFLMSAVELARNMHLDVHRASIWLSIVWQCYLIATSDRTRDHVHIERYFEESLIRHCVEASPLGSKIFTEEEAQSFQKFICGFSRLLPILQLYLFKTFDLELKLEISRPYLRGEKYSSDLDLRFTDTMEDPVLKMNMYNRPKRDKSRRELFKCSKQFFPDFKKQKTD